MEISRDLHYIECMLEQIASRDINYKNSMRNMYRARAWNISAIRRVVELTFRMTPRFCAKKQMPWEISGLRTNCEAMCRLMCAIFFNWFLLFRPKFFLRLFEGDFNLSDNLVSIYFVSWHKTSWGLFYSAMLFTLQCYALYLFLQWLRCNYRQH